MHVLTADELKARTARAVSAATAAGRDLGLEVSQPRVLYDAFSVIVHLAPVPVVVRVPTVLPPSYSATPETQTAQQRRELAVTGWLADRGHPVVPPSPLVPREPVRRDGFSMTFWQLIDEVPDASTNIMRRIEQTAHLHAALRCYDGDLDFWAPFATYIPDGLAALERMPELLSAADLERAQREWSVIAPVLTSPHAFEQTFPGAGIQPIHGDAPSYNMISTQDGDLWSDFELVTLGAIESDLAMVGPEGISAYNAAATAAGLRPVDERVLRVTEAAGRLAAAAALAMVPQLPMLADGLTPTLDEWRVSPPITEV